MRKPQAEVPESILEKIRKLLALTVNPNQNEADNAMLAAQKLLTEYKLEMADIPTGQEKVTEAVTHTKVPCAYGEEWSKALAGAIGYSAYCMVLSNPFSIVFVGDKTDVAACTELFTWLSRKMIRFANYEWERSGYEDGREFIRKFLNGAVLRVSMRLQTKRDEADRSSSKLNTLAKRNQADQEDYIKNAFGKTQPVKRQFESDEISMLGYLAAGDIGLEVEKELPANKPVHFTAQEVMEMNMGRAYVNDVKDRRSYINPIVFKRDFWER